MEKQPPPAQKGSLPGATHDGAQHHSRTFYSKYLAIHTHPTTTTQLFVPWLEASKIAYLMQTPSKSFCHLHLSSQLLYYAQSVTASRLTTAILSLTGSSGFHFPSGNEPEESINFYLLFCSPVLPLCCITSVPCYFTNCFYQVHTKLFCTTAGELH